MNNIREGLIPTVLGTAVTAAGHAMGTKPSYRSDDSNTVFGFGLAHVVLGTIDLMNIVVSKEKRAQMGVRLFRKVEKAVFRLRMAMS